MVSPERQLEILKAIEVTATESLTKIREFLGESYSFDEIRLVRGMWKRRNKNF
jgi:ATP-dependent DNA helicase RecQ